MKGYIKATLTTAAGLAAIVVVATSGNHAAKAADSSVPSACFNVRDLNGFSAPSDELLYIRVGVRDVFRLDLTAGCPNLAFRQGIGLESTPPGEPFICSPLQAEVVYRDNGFPARCQVTAIHKLSEAEYSALPKKDRP